MYLNLIRSSLNPYHERNRIITDNKDLETFVLAQDNVYISCCISFDRFRLNLITMPRNRNSKYKLQCYFLNIVIKS